MVHWYVDQPDKCLDIEITEHREGTFDIGGYLRLYAVNLDGSRGRQIAEIHLRGQSPPPTAGTGPGQGSGSSGGESGGPRDRRIFPIARDRCEVPSVAAAAFAALYSSSSEQEIAEGEETGPLNESNQA